MCRVLFLLLLFLFPLYSPCALRDDAEVKGQERFFSAWLRGQLAYRNLPGVVVGVVSDQQLVWAQGFGLANVDAKIPMTPATEFRMASHSKLFTAMAIMQLRDAGKIHLDDTVATYLPWFQIRPAQPDDPPITIEELLTHDAGLPREAGSHWSDLNFPDAQGVEDFIRGHQAVFPPEVRWKYSNLGFTIAGMVVAAVSGEKWSAYVQDHIFNPLGMTASSVDRDVPGLAVGYGARMPDGTRAKMPFVDARAMAPATGITSNVEDMAKFVSLQFRRGKVGGNQILSTGALRQMHRVRVLENNWQSGNAIGFAVTRVKEKVYVGHGGSYFGYKTQTLMELEPKVGVIVLTNCDDSNPNDIALHLMESVGEAVAKASHTGPPKVPWDPSWRRFAGIYRSRIGGEVDVVELNQRLVALNPSGPYPEHPTRLEPIGNGTFRLEADSGGGPVGEVVRFVERDGKVVRMYVGGSFSDRASDDPQTPK
jgi:CubicO group peptidase (beta-lactamase class C family)